MFDNPQNLVEIVDAMGLLLFGLDSEGRIVAANRHCEAFTGIRRSELVGRCWRELFVDEGRRAQVAALWAELSHAEVASQSFEGLFGSGRRLRWTFTRWKLAGGGVCAVGQDVTEEHAGRARLRASDRISALANLGAGFAHELRNPLNSASLQITLLARKLAKVAGGDALNVHAAEASKEIHRAAALLDDFFAYARPHPLDVRPVEIQSVVRGAVERAAPRAAEAGVVIALVQGPKVVAELDAVRVEGALYNLLANAIDASAGASSPAVAARWITDASSAAIEIEDNGPGLPSPTAPIFDPFFTTKPFGTGLGLAIVERVAIDHGGAVEVTRVDGHTIFRLRLPILHGSRAAT